jgi:two-component system cell cycle sensor histidine kinase PleC
LGIDVAATRDRGLLKHAPLTTPQAGATLTDTVAKAPAPLGLTSRAPVPPTRQEIRLELIQSLYEQAVPILLIDMAVILGITVLFVNIGAPRALHLPWTVALILVALARFLLARRYLEHKHSQSDVPRWSGAFGVTTAVYGAVWGLAGMLFLVPGSQGSLVLLIFLLCGLSAAAVVAYAASLPTFFAFLTLTLAPFAFRLVLVGDSLSMLVFGLLIAWFAFSAAIGHHCYCHLRRRVALQLENARLAHSLEAAIGEVQQKSEAKSQFLANMSHELRTPLNAIIGFSEVMTNQVYGPLGDARYADYMDDIKRSSEHLLRLISDILDLSKIEAGQVELQESEIDVGTVCTECIQLMEKRAHQKRIDLRFAPGGSTHQLKVDPTKFRQIVINLVSNAVQYTPEGGRVILSEEVSPLGAFVLRVSDTGIGMSGADIPRALAPFVQLAATYGTVDPGAGLGLPLVKELVELHGGALQIDSAPGDGTTVTVTLPEHRVLPARGLAA